MAASCSAVKVPELLLEKDTVESNTDEMSICLTSEAGKIMLMKK